jgi:hypothetical protein
MSCMDAYNRALRKRRDLGQNLELSLRLTREVDPCLAADSRVRTR